MSKREGKRSEREKMTAIEGQTAREREKQKIRETEIARVQKR